MRTIVIYLLVVAIGCAGTNKALGVNLATLDTATAALDAYEHQHTEALIAAESGQQLHADVGAFRAKVDKIRADLDGGYRLAAAAGVANDAPSIKTLETVIAAIHAELVTLGVPK